MGSTSVWEIEEEDLGDAAGPHMTLAANGGAGDDVYVAVGRRNSSMDALSWALKHAVKPAGFVYLIHVFPEIHHIPSPLGMVPKNQVNHQQVETYINQQRTKRREMLQKFLNLCHSSKVQVDTLLIESDLIAKAVIDLIPVLNIKRLIVGTSKSSLRRKLKKGSSKAEQIHKSAPNYCQVTIICEGEEVKTSDQATSSPSNTKNLAENSNRNAVGCYCFPKRFL